MARTDTLGHFLTDVADAIRTAEGSSAEITASDFDDRIEALSGGGADLSDYFVMTPTSNDRYIYKLIKNIPDTINTVSITNMNGMFNNCTNLLSCPSLNTSNVTDFRNVFSGCTSLITVGTLNTANGTQFNQMFYQCADLTTVPVLNLSKATSLTNMFYYCNSLSSTSLDNILQMCVGATAYTGTKTLATLGLSSTTYPVATIQALPHYQDFIDAGWTIN